MILKDVIQKLQAIIEKNKDLENLEMLVNTGSCGIKNIDDLSIILTDKGYVFSTIQEMTDYHGVYDIKDCKMVVMVNLD